MLNSILRNHARIDFFDHVVAVVYERVKYTNQIIYALEHQYATKLMEVLMSGTTADEYIVNQSMNAMVVYP